MAKNMMDIGLDAVTGGEDLLVTDGDFVVTESSAMHQQLLILCNKGEWKESPAVGVGAIMYLDDDGSDLVNAITKEFMRDGMDVRSVVMGKDKTITTDAFYI